MVQIEEVEELDSCPECDISTQLIVASWSRGDLLEHTDLFRVCEEDTAPGRANRYYFHFDRHP
jgi:hypothetical protein